MSFGNEKLKKLTFKSINTIFILRHAFWKYPIRKKIKTTVKLKESFRHVSLGN